MEKDNTEASDERTAAPLHVFSPDDLACQKSLLKTWDEIPIQLKTGGLFQEATFAVGYRLGWMAAYLWSAESAQKTE